MGTSPKTLGSIPPTGSAPDHTDPPDARRRRRLRRTVRSFLLSLVILSLLGGAVLAYVEVKLKGNSDSSIDVAERPSGEPMNVLILGSDTRDVLSEEERKTFGTVTGRRTDTIILVHLDEKRKKAIIVSFPRDLRVTLPNGKLGRINTIYQQGPDAFVKTVTRITGLPVHHYVEVNFVGFRNIVNTLGGIDVFFEKPLRDQDSGLNVPAGCVKLDGEQALSFVRVRKIDSDFERIARQQLFLKLMMDKITSSPTLLNPVKLLKLVNEGSKEVTTDASLGIKDMKQLALRLRDFDSSNVDMRVIPSHTQTIGGVSYVISEDKQMQSMFAAIRDGEPLPDYGRTGVSAILPSDVEVSVLNGTSVGGLTKKPASDLRAKGFSVQGTGTSSPSERNVVYFKEGHEEKAKVVAGLFGATVQPMPATFEVESSLALVLGQAYATTKSTPTQASSPTTGASPSPVRGRTTKPPAKPLTHAC